MAKTTKSKPKAASPKAARNAHAAATKAPAKKSNARKPASKTAHSHREPATSSHQPAGKDQANHVNVLSGHQGNDSKLAPFFKKQKDRLLQLRDGMLDSMSGVARDSLRSRAEGSEASAFGMHQADAGSDAYDRDFALSLLSQEQDALHEIDEALKRIELGSYGVCEMSGKPIPHARLEAIPFARFTVECQSQLEKQRKLTRTRQPVTSLFGLTDEEGGAEGEEEETVAETKE